MTLSSPLSALSSYPLLQFAQNLLMLGEAIFLLLRKDQFPVGRDFKDSAAGFDQLGLHPRFLFDRLCQTGSFGVVISIVAIFDRDFLDHTLSFQGPEKIRNPKFIRSLPWPLARRSRGKSFPGARKGFPGYAGLAAAADSPGVRRPRRVSAGARPAEPSPRRDPRIR